MILDCARARPGALGALRLWICALGAALAAALAGCSTNTNISNGTPVVTVHTDGAGEFSTYVVGVSLYSLTRTDGYISYPAGYTAEEFADLSQRVDLTELLNAVGVPTGTYNQIVIGVDYSLPIVYLTGATSQATVENTGGSNPGIVYVTVHLDPAHPLVVSANKSTPLALDFDLAVSDSVNRSTNAVTVAPFVTATTTPTDTEQVRARGLFVATDPSTSSFIENIRPFEDNIYSTVGALTVNTTASTYYNVDGAVLTGADGLSALANLAANTPIVAYGALGDMSSITPGFTATQVYAGTVVSNGAYEHVRGIVSAISGNTLTVTGATYLYYAGYCSSNLCFTYFPSATVTVGPSTVVTEDGRPVPDITSGTISVGSQIDAVGTVANPTSVATTVDLDATAGIVRMQSTPIWGTLTAGATGSATLDLLTMGPIDATAFNFAGTGTTSANNAVASHYQLDTGTADESGTPIGTLVRADGFPTPPGYAPPDFLATDVIPASSEPAALIVEWGAGSSGSHAPFTSYDSSRLALNLAGATLAEVVVGPQTMGIGGTPVITIAGATQFGMGNSSKGVSVFSSPANFVTDLTSTLNGSNEVYRVVAIGSFDSATDTFTASRLDVALE